MAAPSRLSLSTLIELCRVLRHYLGAGLTVQDVFRQQAARGAAAIRPLASRVITAIESGDSLEQALQRDAGAYPPLFLALASVGEETGMLPEVFTELEKYFRRQQTLKRQFISRAAWPVTQFVLAIFVLALLILILGLIAQSHGPGTKPLDPLGLGLSGPSGALIFLSVIWGTIGAIAIGVVLIRRASRQRAAMDRFLLKVPAIGSCLRALALARFCLALRLTTETGMPIARALRLALRATGNEAYLEECPAIEGAVRGGDDLTVALDRPGLFPRDFLHIIAVAEESGRLDDVLRHQADHYHDEASRRLAFLTSLAGYGVWALVGIFIIVAIFRIFMTYIRILNSI
jgi:type IV pilus assembly protein PilC